MLGVVKHIFDEVTNLKKLESRLDRDLEEQWNLFEKTTRSQELVEVSAFVCEFCAAGPICSMPRN